MFSSDGKCVGVADLRLGQGQEDGQQGQGQQIQGQGQQGEGSQGLVMGYVDFQKLLTDSNNLCL